VTTLLHRFDALRAEHPHIRARDAAARLGISEGALAFSGALGTATRLAPDWKALLPALGTLGRVMALARNDHAVHERHGAYEDISLGAGHALVLGPEIDLRIFLSRWCFAVALGGERPSLQFFDLDGAAVHKIFATDATDRAAWDALVARHAEAGSAPPEAAPSPRAATPDNDVDANALRQDWLALRDTHDFIRLLGAHKATRRQAFGLAGDDLARALPGTAGSAALRLAAERGVKVMVFVGNRGCIQIHTGPVARLVDVRGWFNVLDPDFNLHLSEAGVANAFRVRKPTDDGVVTSIELLDAAGEVVAMIFGARKPGLPELPEWRAIADEVAGQAVPA
jgi:putative hemin transport protein